LVLFGYDRGWQFSCSSEKIFHHQTKKRCVAETPSWHVIMPAYTQKYTENKVLIKSCYRPHWVTLILLPIGKTVALPLDYANAMAILMLAGGRGGLPSTSVVRAWHFGDINRVIGYDFTEGQWCLTSLLYTGGADDKNMSSHQTSSTLVDITILQRWQRRL